MVSYSRQTVSGLYRSVAVSYGNCKCYRVLCFVERASRYIRVMKTNLMPYLSSVYFVSPPLHVSGISVAHHQEAYYIYIYIYIYTHTYNNWYVLC